MINFYLILSWVFIFAILIFLFLYLISTSSGIFHQSSPNLSSAGFTSRGIWEVEFYLLSWKSLPELVCCFIDKKVKKLRLRLPKIKTRLLLHGHSLSLWKIFFALHGFSNKWFAEFYFYLNVISLLPGMERIQNKQHHNSIHQRFIYFCMKEFL